MTEVLDEETGELHTLPEDGDDDQVDDTLEPAETPEGRCDAETTVGGTLYRCALDADHDGEHGFQPADGEEPPARDPEKAMREASDKLDKENARHWNRIVEIMQDDAQGLVPCELCFPKTPGYRWDAAPNEATLARVRVAIGLPDLSNFAPSGTEAQCNDCRGLGKVRTGSTVPGRETIVCDPCGGKGYVGTRERLNPDVVPLEAPALEGELPTFEDDGVMRDMFGTPSTDPDFEKMPSARARPVDYWRTNRV